MNDRKIVTKFFNFLHFFFICNFFLNFNFKFKFSFGICGNFGRNVWPGVGDRFGWCNTKYFPQNIKVSPLLLPPPKKLSTGGYMGIWTKYIWTNPKYCNTEANNTLDARCISIQCWYTIDQTFSGKNWFSHLFCVYNAIWW